MAIQLNPNLAHLFKAHKQGKRGIVLEGSSRSGKTWSIVDFIIMLCAKLYKEKQPTIIINIYRDTYNSFKTTLYDDFNRRCPDYGLPPPCTNQDVASIKLFGSKINFIGADKASTKQGSQCDILWINEAIHVQRPVFIQAKMRCKQMFILDYNPEVTEHWIYKEVNLRPDVSFLKTTFLDNPNCPEHQRKEILGYCPHHPDDANLPADERRPHPENIKNGTADAYLWDVFGLGIKAQRKGRVYSLLFDYEDLPDRAHLLGYGLDFGFIDPAVLVKVWQNENEIYLQEIVYRSEMGDVELKELAWERGYEAGESIVADAAEPKAIQVLKTSTENIQGLRVYKADKGAGSVMTGIKLMKSLKIHIHKDSHNVRKDFENYCWEIDERTDEATGKVEHTHSHAPDAVRYLVMKMYRSVLKES